MGVWGYGIEPQWQVVVKFQPLSDYHNLERERERERGREGTNKKNSPNQARPVFVAIYTQQETGKTGLKTGVGTHSHLFDEYTS